MTQQHDLRTITTVLFPDFELLDVYGPLEMFGMFPEAFRLVMATEHASPVASAQGPRSAIDITLGEIEKTDILLVPGGVGTRREVDNPALTRWLARVAPKAELVTSVCAGAALLARAGLLEGRRARPQNPLAKPGALGRGRQHHHRLGRLCRHRHEPRRDRPAPRARSGRQGRLLSRICPQYRSRARLLRHSRILRRALT